MNGSVARSGGYALITGAILYPVSVFIHPAMGTADAMAGASWAWSHWLLVFAAFFVLSGLIAALRSWSGTESESWAIMAVAGVITGSVLILAAVAPEHAGQGAMGTDAGGALLAGSDAGAGLGRGLSWIALATLGMAAVNAEWPPWVGWSGVVVGVAEFVAEFAIDAFATQRLVWLVGFLWLIVVGFYLSKSAAGPQAAAPAAGGTGPAGPGPGM